MTASTNEKSQINTGNLPTPGPWIVGASLHSRKLDITSLTEGTVARCVRLPQVAANAQLMSAAPDLFEAVIDLLATLSKLPSSVLGGDCCIALCKARYAVDKARLKHPQAKVMTVASLNSNGDARKARNISSEKGNFQ